MSDTEYRIEYVIQRKGPGDDDFEEIGFGSSGACDDLASATFAIESYVDNWQWETEPGQPEPEDIKAEIETARANGATS